MNPLTELLKQVVADPDHASKALESFVAENQLPLFDGGMATFFFWIDEPLDAAAVTKRSRMAASSFHGQLRATAASSSTKSSSSADGLPLDERTSGRTHARGSVRDECERGAKRRACVPGVRGMCARVRALSPW